MRETFGRVLSGGSIGESLPNSESFVDLASEANDANGIPLAQIHSQLGESEIKRLTFMAKTAREISNASVFHSSGGGRVRR